MEEKERLKVVARTQEVIDTYRGVPCEFGMLKGILCLPGDSCKSVREQFDLGMIASRMDEINAADMAEIVKASRQEEKR